VLLFEPLAQNVKSHFRLYKLLSLLHKRQQIYLQRLLPYGILKPDF